MPPNTQQWSDGSWQSCPNRLLLADFLAGQLETSEIEAIGEHLSECSDCSGTIAELWESRSVKSELRPTGLDLPSGSQTLSYGDRTDHRRLQAKLHAIRPGEPMPVVQKARVVEAEGFDFRGVRIPSSIGQYDLEVCLGQGAMGVVFRAWHRRLKRQKVLKILLPTHANVPEYLRRFELEMAAVGALGEHPNVVRANDAAEVDGLYFIAMDFTPGTDVSSLITRVGALRVADACEIAKQAALGLSYAHQNGILHRDVKPSNLLLTDDGVVKVLDLGLAAFQEDADAEDAEGDYVVGTADYLAPERWLAQKNTGPESDIYSLGCTLFKLLCGKVPFHDKTPNNRAKRIAHLRRVAPSLESLRPNIPPALDAIVARMMAKKPSDRFHSAAEVAEALEPWTAGADLSGLSKEAFPEQSDTHRMGIEQTLVTRIAKRLRREPRWRLATLLGAACLLLAIGLAWAMTTLPANLASEAVEVPRVVFPLEPTATLWRYDEQGALVRVNAKYSSLISFDQEFAGTGTIKTRIHFPEHQGSGGVYYGYRIRDDPEADTHFFSAIVINVDEDADLYRVEHIGYQVYDADKGYTAWIPTTLATATVPFVESAPAFFLTLEFDEGRFTSAKLGDHVCDWHRVADSTLWEVPGGAGLFCSSGEMTLSRPEVTTTRVNSGP